MLFKAYFFSFQIDPQPKVSFKEAAELADKFGAASYVECSAMTSDGICEVIREAIETVQKQGDCRKGKGKCCGCNLV